MIHLKSSTLTLRMGLCAVALTAMAATVPANAVVISFTTPIAVPATLDGIYINFATGATGTSGPGTPGWDFNPYLSTALSFFWNPTPVDSSGGVATAATGGQYIDLALGTSVSAASVFTRITASAATAQFQAIGAHTLGFRFFNEGTSAINYGYLTYQTAGSNGFPGTITGWSFDNTGAAITVVPEPGTALMLSLGALVIGMTALRRKRQA